MFKHQKVIFLALLLILLCTPAVSAQNQADEVRELVLGYYVDVPPAAVMEAGTVDEILNTLGDPHSVYFTSEEYNKFEESLDQRFFGIGIYMEMIPQGVKVLSVIKGAPAEKAGIKSGDIIIQAGEDELKGLSAEESMALLRGPQGSKVKLSVQRGAQTFQFVATRQEVEVPTATGKLVNQGKTGYIDINSFGMETAAEFGEEFKRLKKSGVQNWIIDLRDNTGGYLNTAFEMAGYFTGERTVIKMQEREQAELGQGVRQPEMVCGPVVLLVNRNSASAAEVLAGALKDYRRALVIGEKTYGKGTVQKVFELSGGDILKLTVARFYSPQGKVIDQQGIMPDMVLEKNQDALSTAEMLLSGAKDTNEKAFLWPEVKGIPADMPFYVNLAGECPANCTPGMILIDAESGAAVPIKLKLTSHNRVIVNPSQVLTPGRTYWLLTGIPTPGQGLIKISVMNKNN